MNVYYMNVSGIDPDDKKWYKYLSEKRIEKVNKLKKKKNKAQSIGAELLLNYAVSRETDIKTPVKWETDENGKLYLRDIDGFYVNLSHSGEYAVCVTCDSDVGIDIQYCDECDMGVAERFFTPEETLVIKNSKNPNKAFYDIWTKKESFLKAVGCGLTVPINSFSVLKDTVQYGKKTYRFKEYTVKNPDYKLFTCFLDCSETSASWAE